MTERKRRKKNKVRGERTHSKGDTKNNRGGGSRGGRGRAGANKGKLFSIGQNDKRKYRLKAAPKERSISLGYLDEKIDELVSKGKVRKEKDSYIVDKSSGYGTILGQGNINKKLILRINASKKAIEKVKKAGGKFEFEKKALENSDEEIDDVDFEVDD